MTSHQLSKIENMVSNKSTVKNLSYNKRNNGHFSVSISIVKCKEMLSVFTGQSFKGAVAFLNESS